MISFRATRPTPQGDRLSRRSVLKAGVLGLTGLTLPTYLQLKAETPAPGSDRAVILFWLDGGPSQLETYDPKPDAPVEYRGPYGVIRTKLPGVMLSDRLPHHARHADKIALIRSLHHDTGDHFAAAHWMTTGRFGATSVNLPQKFPSVGSYVSRVKGANAPGVPAYVGLPAAESVYLFPGYMGAAYLGGAYNPFDVDREAKYLGANDTRRVRSPKWLTGLSGGPSLNDRQPLLKQFDGMRRDLDASGTAATMDQYQQQAIELMSGSRARTAFDIDREDPRTADRYGQNPWGRYALMARRLVEAGVSFVTVDMPHWDDHSGIEKGHGYKLPPVDQAVGALLDDLTERGLLDRVMLVVMGEFGRTPKINTGQPGIPVPGRDHWGNAISAMMAGGGLKGGQVVGATNARAEYPVERPLKPADLLATVYHQLGIDPRLQFKDHTGRPHTILDEGEAIRELI